MLAHKQLFQLSHLMFYVYKEHFSNIKTLRNIKFNRYVFAGCSNQLVSTFKPSGEAVSTNEVLTNKCTCMWKPRVHEEGRPCIRFSVLMNNFTPLEVRGSLKSASKRRKHTRQGTGGKGLAGIQGGNAGGDFTVSILIEIVVVFLGFLLQSFLSVEWSVLILFFL